MPRSVFVSYSHKDEAHKDRLVTHLKLMERQNLIAPWDDRQIMPAEEWEPDIETHLETADLILLLISADFIASDYCWCNEMKRAMERHEAQTAKVLPIFVDHCDWKGAPFGKLQGVPKDAVPVTEFPNQAKAWTEVSKAIRSVLPSSQSTGRPSVSVPGIHWTDELRIYGEKGLFAGRTAELELLDDALEEGKARVVSLWAEGGAGKTRLLFQWLNAVRDDGWRGIGTVYVHSFYSQGNRSEGGVPTDAFFEDALKAFGYQGEPITDMRQKGIVLAEHVAKSGGLLVLDGLEPLQYPPNDVRAGELRDGAISALLLTLANLPGGLCLVSTRQALPELKSRKGVAVRQHPLDRLNTADGVLLLKELGVAGPDRELRAAVEDYHGHAYSLMLLGTYLKNATADHDIRKRHDTPLLEKDEEHDHHADHLFETYVRHLGAESPELAVLRLIGFFERPATPELITVLRADKEDDLSDLIQPLLKLNDAGWQRVLNRLVDLRLLSVAKNGSLDSHPLLREYFAERLREDTPDAFCAGHRRLYEHLCEATEHQPDTLAGLQPLYQAVRHGCLAGMAQQTCDDVFWSRIRRGAEVYSTHKLGAVGADLGAVACFFEVPWRTFRLGLSESDQSWLLSEAAFSLRALGRLTEALEPMRVGMDRCVELEDWKNAAASAGNLSELELTLGRVDDAVRDAAQSVEFADRGDDASQRVINRTTHADALHQAGRWREALELLREVEAMQAEDQPEYPRLYSLRGFQYCDLLLGEVEQVAGVGGQESVDKSLLTACDEVEERARQTLEWVKPQNWILDIALDQLTLARVELYRAILTGKSIGDQKSEIDPAVAGLRQAGQMQYFPLGLLTRAWWRSVAGDEAGSRTDLDEAREIAERGEMKLFMADVQLYRARLFGDREALEQAEKLINETGYHRRDEELEAIRKKLDAD